MTILESARGDTFANVPQNYLYDYCRRTGNMANIANFFVEDRIDGDTGFVVFYIHPVADAGTTPSIDPADPLPIAPTPGDPTTSAETQVLS